MTIKQISVFIENRTGRLYDITHTLAMGGVNIRAFSVADTVDFGILRLIVDKPAQAVQVLKEGKFTVSETEVIAVRLGDQSGDLSHVLKVLLEDDISVEYGYAFVSHSVDSAMVILRVSDNNRAVQLFAKAGVEVMGEQMIEKL